MSQTAAALRAAKEVQADVLAPELFRTAQENFVKAKREYKFKNFSFATIYLKKARRLAEDAEFEALRNGGNRTSEQVADPLASGPAGAEAAPPQTSPSGESGALKRLAPDPASYPTPAGTPWEEFEKRNGEEASARKKAEASAGTDSSGGAPSGPTSEAAPPGVPSTPH